MAINFDGPNKRIILDRTTITVAEIWSAWVDWHPFNLNWEIAMSQRGGNLLVGDIYEPVNFFLMNGWRIRPMEASHKLVITGNLFVYGGGDPIVQTLGNYNVSVQYTVPLQAQAIATSGGTSSGLTVEQVTAAVLDALASEHELPGTIGERLKKILNTSKTAMVLSA